MPFLLFLVKFHSCGPFEDLFVIVLDLICIHAELNDPESILSFVNKRIIVVNLPILRIGAVIFKIGKALFRFDLGGNTACIHNGVRILLQVQRVCAGKNRKFFFNGKDGYVARAIANRICFFVKLYKSGTRSSYGM